MSRVFLAEETAARAPGRHQGAAAGDGRRRQRRAVRARDPARGPPAASRTSCRSSPPARPAICSTTSCPSSRASRCACGSRAQGELPIAEALRILREVADALAYAHAQRRRPPGHQAGQRAALGGPRRGDRLRRRQGGERVERRRASRPRSAWRSDAGVHGAGAGRGRSARRSSRRHLRARRAGVRDALRADAVHAPSRPGTPGRAHHPDARSRRATPAVDLPGAQRGRDALPREARRRSLAERVGAGGAARCRQHAERRADADPERRPSSRAAPRRPLRRASPGASRGDLRGRPRSSSSPCV